VNSKLGVRWENEDVLRGRSGLAVVFDVPYTGAVDLLDM
jgi:hypothetical protein